MTKSKPIPVLTDVIGEDSDLSLASALDSADIDALAQAIEKKLQPLVKEAIRDAVGQVAKARRRIDH